MDSVLPLKSVSAYMDGLESIVHKAKAFLPACMVLQSNQIFASVMTVGKEECVTSQLVPMVAGEVIAKIQISVSANQVGKAQIK